MKKLLLLALCSVFLFGCSSGSKEETVTCQMTVEESYAITKYTSDITFKGDTITKEVMIREITGEAAEALKKVMESNGDNVNPEIGEYAKVEYEEIEDGFKSIVTIDLSSLSADELKGLSFPTDKEGYIELYESGGFTCK